MFRVGKRQGDDVFVVGNPRQPFPFEAQSADRTTKVGTHCGEAIGGAVTLVDEGEGDASIGVEEGTDHASIQLVGNISKEDEIEGSLLEFPAQGVERWARATTLEIARVVGPVVVRRPFL